MNTIFLRMSTFTTKLLRNILSQIRIHIYHIREAKIANKVFIGKRVYISNPSNIELSTGTILTRDYTLSAFKKIKIGKNVQLIPFSAIYDSNHIMPINKGKRNIEEVIIGEGCWIGHGSTILKGVVLEKNVIVAAGSVVTKSFPDNSVITGAPAQRIKKLL